MLLMVSASEVSTYKEALKNLNRLWSDDSEESSSAEWRSAVNSCLRLRPQHPYVRVYANLSAIIKNNTIKPAPLNIQANFFSITNKELPVRMFMQYTDKNDII